MTLEAKLIEKQGKGVWYGYCAMVQNNYKNKEQMKEKPIKTKVHILSASSSFSFNFYCCCLDLSVQQAEAALKAAEKEREETLSEETQKLNGLRSQIEQKIKLLEPREREAEAMVYKV
jgi:hypothetical protein